MLISDLEQRFAPDFSTSLPMKEATGEESGSVQTEFSSLNIVDRSEMTTVSAVPITAEAKTGNLFGSLTCGINETINECGRACETNCSNVSLT